MRNIRLDISDPFMRVAMERIHEASGFDYKFPAEDLKTPIFPVQRVVVDFENNPIAAAALKVTPEAYLWVDHERGTPESRMEALQLLHSDLAHRARNIGFDHAYCVLPPEIAERFGKRLEDLGWKAARPWPLYTFQLR